MVEMEAIKQEQAVIAATKNFSRFAKLTKMGSRNTLDTKGGGGGRRASRWSPHVTEFPNVALRLASKGNKPVRQKALANKAVKLWGQRAKQSARKATKVEPAPSGS